MSCRTHKSLLALAAVVAIAGLAPGSPVTGQAHAGPIQRCAAPDGTTLYTDRPCASFDAMPLAMPAGFDAHLADASQAEARATGAVDAAAPLFPGNVTRGPAYARRSAASGCAHSPTQLAMDLQGAFALGDVNRIAESWQWVGLDHQSALPVMQRLERLAMSTVVDTRYYDAAFVGGAGNWASADAAAVAGGILQLTLGGEGGHQVLDLRVEPYKGCYFVRF